MVNKPAATNLSSRSHTTKSITSQDIRNRNPVHHVNQLELNLIEDSRPETKESARSGQPPKQTKAVEFKVTTTVSETNLVPKEAALSSFVNQAVIQADLDDAVEIDTQVHSKKKKKRTSSPSPINFGMEKEDPT
jgi:hypothetical protein